MSAAEAHKGERQGRRELGTVGFVQGFMNPKPDLSQDTCITPELEGILREYAGSVVPPFSQRLGQLTTILPSMSLGYVCKANDAESSTLILN